MRSLSITNEPVRVNPAYRDWLPSLNVAWALGSRANLRAAYGQTLARPEFREMAPFSYFDFLANELVQGNPALRRSRITNMDLRFELFPSRGQVMAVSAFYKIFKDPIEQVLIAASGFEPIRTYENADGAVTRGIEMELRKKLDFVWGRLERFSFIGNISLIRSEINLSGENEYQEDRRPLQGQADYVSNLGLYYDEFDGRLSASLTYNKVGKRISRVGFANLGDIIEMPRDQVDASVSVRIHRHLALKASVKDILGQDHVFVQKTLDGDKTAERRKTGRFFSLGFTLQ
jgi:TonB-dependent receptor